MRIRGTRALYRYWHEAKDGEPFPRRSAIEPRGLKEVLPWVFILDHVDREMTAFRLAGTGVCEHYGRELRGTNFLSLWLGDCRRTVRSLIENVIMMPAPAYIEFEAQARNDRHLFGEILLLPMLAEDGEVHQILGGWFPAVTHDPLIERPLLRHHILNIKMLTDEEPQPARQAASGSAPLPPGAGPRLVISNKETV